MTSRHAYWRLAGLMALLDNERGRGEDGAEVRLTLSAETALTAADALHFVLERWPVEWLLPEHEEDEEARVEEVPLTALPADWRRPLPARRNRR